MKPEDLEVLATWRLVDELDRKGWLLTLERVRVWLGNWLYLWVARFRNIDTAQVCEDEAELREEAVRKAASQI